MSFEPNPWDAPAPPASEHPLMVYQGQMMSREMAATRRAELMANSEYAQAAINGDVAKQTELKDLWMLERGHEPSPMQTVVDVAAQEISREQWLSAARRRAATALRYAR